MNRSEHFARSPFNKLMPVGQAALRQSIPEARQVQPSPFNQSRAAGPIGKVFDAAKTKGRNDPRLNSYDISANQHMNRTYQHFSQARSPMTHRISQAKGDNSGQSSPREMHRMAETYRAPVNLKEKNMVRQQVANDFKQPSRLSKTHHSAQRTSRIQKGLQSRKLNAIENWTRRRDGIIMGSGC